MGVEGKGEWIFRRGRPHHTPVFLSRKHDSPWVPCGPRGVSHPMPTPPSQWHSRILPADSWGLCRFSEVCVFVINTKERSFEVSILGGNVSLCLRNSKIKTHQTHHAAVGDFFLSQMCVCVCVRVFAPSGKNKNGLNSSPPHPQFPWLVLLYVQQQVINDISGKSFPISYNLSRFLSILKHFPRTL